MGWYSLHELADTVQHLLKAKIRDEGLIGGFAPMLEEGITKCLVASCHVLVDSLVELRVEPLVADDAEGGREQRDEVLCQCKLVSR